MYDDRTFPIEFVKLRPEHFARLELQESQRWQYGLDVNEMGDAEAEHYAEQPNSWACVAGEAVLAIVGINEVFEGVQGVAFALLGKDLGPAHHRLSRFVRDTVIGKCELARVEAIVRCADPPADLTDPCDRLAFCFGHPTPEVRWAFAVGLVPVAVLRKFGAASETHMLLERIG